MSSTVFLMSTSITPSTCLFVVWSVTLSVIHNCVIVFRQFGMYVGTCVYMSTHVYTCIHMCKHMCIHKAWTENGVLFSENCQLSNGQKNSPNRVQMSKIWTGWVIRSIWQGFRCCGELTTICLQNPDASQDALKLFSDKIDRWCISFPKMGGML